MHAISSYRGNRATNTHPQTNLQTGPITIYTAPQLASAQCNNSSIEEATKCLLRVLLKSVGPYTLYEDVFDSEWTLDKSCTRVGIHLTTDKNVCIVYDQS